MKKIIITEKHMFNIELKECSDKSCFEIVATDLSNNTKSTITNLNFIISEIIEPILNLDDYDSTLFINHGIGKELFLSSTNSFSDKGWVKLLELKLQEDKEEGKWS